MSSAAARVLLFGGTFDPPHIGHMALLQNAIGAVRPGEVLVIPTGEAPHKQASDTPARLRLAMCACFLPLHPALRISTIETARKGKSYTSDTLRRLRAGYPGAALYLCVGGDMLRSFTRWHQWREILRHAALVVDGREDTAADAEAAAALRGAGGQVLFAPGAVPRVSSSGLRQAARAGEDISRWVPPPAYGIVLENGLYREQCAGRDNW